MKRSYPIERRNLLDPCVLNRLSRPETARWLLAVATEWGIIALLFGACLYWRQWWVCIPAALLVGTRQHGLSILGHEGAHRLIARSRFWNDQLANWLTCYPLLFTVQGYRKSHLSHHWYLETPNDPSRVSVVRHEHEWHFPMTKRQAITILVRDLTGLGQASSAGLLAYLWKIDHRLKHMLAIALLVFGAMGWAYATGNLLILMGVWFVPLFTVTVACYRIRATAEHSGFTPHAERYRRTSIDPLTTSRTTILSPLLAPLLAPYNVTYHIEHHLYPSVPGFNLKRLHEALSDSEEYRRHAHLTHGYADLFREFTGQPVAKAGSGV